LADITKVKVVLSTGIPVEISSPDNSALTVATLSGDLNISNTDGQVIASFSESAVAYWTTDLILSA